MRSLSWLSELIFMVALGFTCVFSYHLSSKAFFSATYCLKHIALTIPEITKSEFFLVSDISFSSSQRDLCFLKAHVSSEITESQL